MRFTVTTEQQVALYNILKGDSSPALIALYPEEGSFWQDYNFCISDADWVPPSHRAALKIFLQLLSSRLAQLEAKRKGFRPFIVSVPELDPTEAGRIFQILRRLPKQLMGCLGILLRRSFRRY